MAIEKRTANQDVGRKYHCYIDGQGFIIQDESYQEKNVPFDVPRFATGDPTLADFSTFQYAGQTDWSQGVGEDGGQKYFVNPSQFKDSEFIDISDKGEIKLEKPLAELVDCGAGDITQIKSFSDKCYFGLQKSGGASEVWRYDGSTAPVSVINLSAITGAGGVSAFGDFQAYRNKLQFSSMKSQMWFAWDGTNFVSSSKGGTAAAYEIYSEQWNEYLYTPSLDNLDRYDGSGKLSAAGSWQEEFDTYNYLLYRPKVYRNKLYMLAGVRGLDTDVYGNIYSESQLIVYDGNNYAPVATFPYRAYSMIEVYDNRLWFIVDRNLFSFDGVNVIKELSLAELYGDNLFVSPNDAQQEGHRLKRVGDKLYLIVNDSANSTSELYIYNGDGWVRWGEQPDASNYYHCIGNMDLETDDLFLIGDSAGKVWKVSAGYSTTDTGYVESSWFDFDLFSIEKVFSNMSVYHEALPENTSVTMKYKIDDDSAWNTLGSNSTKNTTMESWEFPANTKGAKLKYMVELTTTTSASTPCVQDIIIKYRLTPQEKDTKKQWTFNVVLAGKPDSYLTLLDNTREKMSGKEMRNFLWRAKEKDMFEFINPQGETVNVVFEELNINGPFIDNKNGEMQYLAQITLIEV